MLIRGIFLAVFLFAAARPATAEHREVDPGRLAAAGLRVLEGRHLRLLTDLPASPAVDELPAVFDAAVSQWAAYCGVDEAGVLDWRVLGCLINDRATFAAVGLMPRRHPDFANGFAEADRIWLVEQPSDYYRRHLLLHEGTHAFMQRFLDGAGPGWFMEGTAELLGAHVWGRDELQLAAFPQSRDVVPMWGRVKILRDAAAADASWPLDAVLELDNTRNIGVEGYAWSWALTALLDSHPQFQQRFRALVSKAGQPRFNRRFRRLFAEDWGDLQCEWQAYAADIDYGYDFTRMAMIHREPRELGEDGATVAIRADRGWQSAGVILRGGRHYRVSAEGRYVVAADEEGAPWPCEPGGVTLRWHAGRPLGELLAALRPVTGIPHQQTVQQSGASPPPRRITTTAPDFASPRPVGLQATIAPIVDSLLYVRVNDSPAELADNEGELTVSIAAD